MASCSFDQATCSVCQGVKDWSLPSAVLTGDDACKKAVDSYCQKNQKVPYCSCWDTTLASYTTADCEMVRNLHNKNKKFADVSQLDKDTLEMLKSKYKLTESKSCPSTPVPIVAVDTTTERTDIESMLMKIDALSDKKTNITFWEWLTSWL
jgi:hypothetical protein